MSEWVNDFYVHCKSCDCISKSYFLDESGSTQFCPNCGSRNLEAYDEEE
jgi:Zn finger protein HypA/HybF involved in hydrogenase expression